MQKIVNEGGQMNTTEENQQPEARKVVKQTKNRILRY